MQLRSTLAEIEQQRDDLEKSVATKTDALGIVVEEARTPSRPRATTWATVGLDAGALKSLRGGVGGDGMMLGVALRGLHALRSSLPSAKETRDFEELFL